MTEVLRPANIDMADLISSIFRGPVTKTEEAEDEETEAPRQIRAATPEEMTEIEALALRAATLQDEVKLIIERAVAGRTKELAALKAQLLDRMLTHNLTEVWVPGRAPVEVVTRNERKPTKKSLIAALTKINGGDAKKGAFEANQLWNTIPQVPKPTLSIPEASAPDIDSPY